MTFAGWFLERLRFSGDTGKLATLDFARGLTLVYGASNTGKSFAVKSIDFMLGGGRELPNIQERRGYTKISLDLALASGSVSLERAIVGGPFTLREADRKPRTLGPKHDANNPANISTFLMTEMGSAGKKVAVDASGTHNNLTFRDIASIVLTNEIAIQSETSPVESGDKGDAPRERNVFKFLLTGEDDSAIVPIVKPKDFRTGRAAKATILQEMIDEVNADIAAKYQDPDGLADQSRHISETLQRIEDEIVSARSSIRILLDQKRQLSADISIAERRSVDIALSLESFGQLQDVYNSDIARLEALEEVGFLLGLNGTSACPVCGAPPEAQAHVHGLADIEDVRIAAELEVKKVKQQREELIKAVEDTKAEAVTVAASIRRLREALSEVERRLIDATPSLNEHQRKLSDVISIRDHVRHGQELLARRDSLSRQKDDVETSKPPKRDVSIQRGLSTETAREFADVVSQVLVRWGFPGRKDVVFDLSTFDLIIDGKERRNNGKGVRAITHAAFKVALLLFCRDHDRPHPGFLVLDSPLITYRDPLKRPGDRLTLDEEEIRKTDLKQRFFDHVGHLGERTQVVVFENIDPPEGVENYALVEAFTNDPGEGRQGLL